jgi:hypothetical protein
LGCVYAEKEAHVPIKQGVSMKCIFVLMKWFKSLVKASMSTPEAVESSWSLEMRDSWSTRCIGNPEKLMVQPEGL